MEKLSQSLSDQETGTPNQTESNPDNNPLNPVGHITEKDKTILEKRGLPEKDYCRMWELPLIEDTADTDVNEARQKCLTEYDD